MSTNVTPLTATRAIAIAVGIGLCGLLVAGEWGWAAKAADKTTPASEGTTAPKEVQNEDQELLQSLDNELLEGLDEPAKPAESDADPSKAPPAPSADPSDKPPKSANPGKSNDAQGSASADDPLAKIASKMKGVERQIASKQVDQSTQRLQAEILRDLDELLKQCQGQCQGGGGGKPGSKPGSSAGKGGQSGGKSGNAAPAESPARESSPNERRQSAQPVEQVSGAELMKGSWGRLPDKARAQMLETAADEFLPKYDQLLRRYFQRLGEEQAQEGP